MNLLRRLWHDETGAVISTELVLAGSTLVAGMLVGMTTLRDQVVQELSDTAEAISEINQSYSYTGVTSHNAWTAGSDFDDKLDVGDANNGENGKDGGVDVTAPPEDEEGDGTPAQPAEETPPKNEA